MLFHKLQGAGGVGGAAIVEGAFNFQSAIKTELDSFDYATALSQSPNNNDKFSMSYDGTKMFIVLNDTGLMYGFDLSTAWDISTASYSGESSGSLGSRTQGSWKPDGTAFFYTKNDSNIYKVTASTAWDCSTFGTPVSQSTAINNLRGFGISTDGTKGIVFSNGTNRIYEVDFSTAWDVTTATIDTGSTISEPASPDEGLNTSIDGLMVYMHEGTTISQYALATAWDLSSYTETDSTYSAADGRSAWSSTDGVYGYALDSNSNGYVRQFSTTGGGSGAVGYVGYVTKEVSDATGFDTSGEALDVLSVASVGDLVVIAFALANAPDNTWSWNGMSFTSIFDNTDQNNPGNYVGYRIVEEGDSNPYITGVTSGSWDGLTVMAAVFRNATTLSGSAQASGSGLPDPPSLTADGTLYVCVGHTDNDYPSWTAPANYTLVGWNLIDTGSGDSSTMMAFRLADLLTTDDPASFGGGSSSSTYRSATLAFS